MTEINYELSQEEKCALCMYTKDAFNQDGPCLLSFERAGFPTDPEAIIPPTPDWCPLRSKLPQI